MELKDIEKMIKNNKEYILENGLINDIRGENKKLLKMTKLVLRGTTVESKLIEKDILTNSKYMVKGLEDLSTAVANLLTSGYGGYILDYERETSLNHFISGFKTKKELKSYAIWAIEYFNKYCEKVEMEIKERKLVEEGLSSNELAKKYMAQKEAKMNVYKNIFDSEKKQKYCEQVSELETINSILEKLVKIHKFIGPVYLELSKIS